MVRNTKRGRLFRQPPVYQNRISILAIYYLSKIIIHNITPSAVYDAITASQIAISFSEKKYGDLAIPVRKNKIRGKGSKTLPGKRIDNYRRHDPNVVGTRDTTILSTDTRESRHR